MGCSRAVFGAVDGFTPGGWPQSAGVCSYAEAAVRLAEAGTDATVVFATTCDQLRRGFDTAILHGNRRGFLFNLSATWQSMVAEQIFRSELVRLGRFLLANGGTMPTAGLAAAGIRTIQRPAPTTPRVRAKKRLTSVCGGNGALPLGWRVLAPARSGADSSSPTRAGWRPFSRQRIGNLLDAIEAAGGRVVLNATETGERSLSPFFELKAGSDPI